MACGKSCFPLSLRHCLNTWKTLDFTGFIINSPLITSALSYVSMCRQFIFSWLRFSQKQISIFWRKKQKWKPLWVKKIIITKNRKKKKKKINNNKNNVPFIILPLLEILNELLGDYFRKCGMQFLQKVKSKQWTILKAVTGTYVGCRLKCLPLRKWSLNHLPWPPFQLGTMLRVNNAGFASCYKKSIHFWRSDTFFRKEPYLFLVSVFILIKYGDSN